MSDQRPLINDSSAADNKDSATHATALPSLGFSPVTSSLGFNPTSVSPPLSPHVSRPSYQRLGSDAPAAERNAPQTVIEEEEEDIADSLSRRSVVSGVSGLGIAKSNSPPPGPMRRVSTQSITRRPLPSHTRSPPVTSPALTSPPNTGDPFLSGFPPHSGASTPDLRRERFGGPQDGGEYDSYRRDDLKQPNVNTTSANNEYQSNDYQQYLRASNNGAPSIKSAYDQRDFHPAHHCATQRSFYHSRFTWVSITIVLLCLFSTIFSGIFLGLALKAPRYGRQISSSGSFTPSDAILLTTIMAKLIELSFVTCFVAFLGQVLSRRAFMKEHGRGVTLSELSMWRWIVQPGTLITHPSTARYAGLSVLGMMSLLSAALATLYSSAATALVQPLLKDGGKFGDVVLAGRVKTGFANVNYVKSSCNTPINIHMDENNAGSTCSQLDNAGKAYYNLQEYLTTWKQWDRYGNGTSDQARRPPGYGFLYGNTTVTGQWIDIIDTTKESKKYGRAINQVSLAMPHAGVFTAARLGQNDIMQPEELNSEGTYSLRASVPSPVMNVLCANMNEKELEPIVYNMWGNNETIKTIADWETARNNATTLNDTVVDELFGWTKKDDERYTDYPPVFPKIPDPFNTIMNNTAPPWGRHAIWLLGSGGNMDDGTKLNGTYSLCRIHVTLTSKCSTQYNAAGSGGSMEALCEDKDPGMAYINSNSTEAESVTIVDWRDVGSDWSNALSMNTGIVDSRSSTSRVLTQFMMKPNSSGEYNLNPSLPSMAEAIAVLGGSSLLMSSVDAPYVMFWNYTTDAPLLDEFTHQYFNASVRAQQYASGGVDNVSKGWMIILVLVFLMNIFVLAYFLFHKGLVTDFSEPPNLFALAVNSPPSHLFAGSCGGGPGGKQYVVNWFVNSEGDHLYMEPGQSAAQEKAAMAGAMATGHEHAAPPATTKTKKPKGPGFLAGMRQRMPGFGSKKEEQKYTQANVTVTDVELEDAQSKVRRQYNVLSNRRSML